jgi:hypothetical protein
MNRILTTVKMARTPLLLTALSAWFCAPLFVNVHNLGVRDWDQHLFYFASFLKSVQLYQQFPLWNPWYCGGSVLFQNPQIPLTSPTYLLGLLMTVPVAMKFNIVLHYFLALTGVVAIARRVFRIRALLLTVAAGSVFVFNSFFSLQISEGHSWMLTAAYIPFAYLGFEDYLQTRRVRSIIFGAAALALMVLSGGIYTTPYLALFLCSYAAGRSIIGRTVLPLKTLMLFGTYGFLFSAFKLVPVIDYMLSYPRLAGGRESIPLAAWGQIFFGRDQTLFSTHSFSGQVWKWHEYGSYLGLVYVLLIIMAVSRTVIRHRHSRNEPGELSLTLCLFGFFVLFAGDFAYVTPYTILRHLPVFSSMHVPSRFLIICLFISALLLLGLVRALMPIFLGNPVLKSIVYGLCVFIILDLIWVNSKAFKDAFTINPSNVYDQDRIIPDAVPYLAVMDLPRYGDVYSSMYAGLLRNQNVVDCYEPIRPTRGFELGSPLVFTRDPEIRVSRIRLTPNHVAFDAQAGIKGRVYLNQNYVKGWSLAGAAQVVEEHDHKPSFVLVPGSYRDLAFYFLPKSVFWGLLLTLIGIVGATLHCAYQRTA